MGNKHGLEASAPQRGALRDCHEVAATATLLAARLLAHRFSGEPEDWHQQDAARHAAELHRVSGALHRIAERECNEGRACGLCGGEGRIHAGQVKASERDPSKPLDYECHACAGHGTRDGRQLARLRSAAEEIAKRYGLVPYFQTDPRGCALYLIHSDIVPQSWAAVPGDPLERYVYPNEAKSPPTLDTLRRRWIEANYTRGHAVVRVGR